MAHWKSLPMILTSDPPKGIFECSNCSYHIDKYNYESLPDQCPNCGEDMGDIGAKINWRKDETGTIDTVISPKYGMNGWQKEGKQEARSDSYGWTCPVCGRGLSPFISCCPCKGQLKFEITC